MPGERGGQFVAARLHRQIAVFVDADGSCVSLPNHINCLRKNTVRQGMAKALQILFRLGDDCEALVHRMRRTHSQSCIVEEQLQRLEYTENAAHDDEHNAEHGGRRSRREYPFPGVNVAKGELQRRLPRSRKGARNRRADRDGPRPGWCVARHG